MDGTSLVRRVLTTFVLGVCFLLILNAYFLEPFQVPTGSMAPALLGHHRTVACPRCGIDVTVGRVPADRDGSGGDRYYTKACCPNCGCAPLPLATASESRGDQALVNKSLYALRRPRRWEVVVFQLFGKIFIKRLIGLDGEEIEIVDGDVYVNGELARKTFEELKAMRVLLFDNEFAPAGEGWKDRWETDADPANPWRAGQTLVLDGRRGPTQLTYRNFSLDERKCQPITNEYAYNAGNQATPEPVHDFIVVADVEIVEGTGALSFVLTDGATEVEVEAPVGAGGDVVVRSLGPPVGLGFGKVQLEAGKTYRVEMAFVDRRVTFRIDGREVFPPVDLAPAKERASVIRPLRFGAEGVFARLHHVRLYRDLHYTQAGKNGVRGRSVRLPIDQTFVLGDNSANSEDSRFWRDQGAVPVSNFLGRAFLVHLPSAARDVEGLGVQWQVQLPDWPRVRLLR